jgi:uncharacterized membrane protein
MTSSPSAIDSSTQAANLLEPRSRVGLEPRSRVGSEPRSRVGPEPRSRVESVDVLRGVIMFVMALDHVRDFFGHPGVDPTDPAHASVALFFTRWVTHFCAPVFFLLAGTGSFLALRRRSPAELSRFLLARGAWLLFLDLFVVRCFGLQFNFDYRVTVIVVLWALGWAMIVLAGLVRLPVGVAVWFGAAMVALHNAFDGVSAAAFGALAPLWTILHAPGVLYSSPRVIVRVSYPLIPWLGVTALGYGLGQIYLWPAARRRAFLLRLGLALCAAFVALRAVGLYGDPSPWSAQATPVRTVLSFLRTTKYPPSLLFLLMTLGPALLLLAALDRGTPAPLRPALVVGRVPLFYYVVHMTLIHLVAVAVCLARYGSAHWMFESPRPDVFPFTPPPGWGFDLPVVYLIWLAVILAMYPLSRWFAGVKRRSDSPWLSYL